ncbi:hypothetical protein Vafri_5058 [Volvox africanus]|uniref:Uncharacterized protein n=1 Tax=Volvox africanus TaxID=51714 RepID=A0A8J4AZU6_9CHLO|nr:hypothetical protein Vafri_5058 [Volvox africanus]
MIRMLSELAHQVRSQENLGTVVQQVLQGLSHRLDNDAATASAANVDRNLRSEGAAQDRARDRREWDDARGNSGYAAARDHTRISAHLHRQGHCVEVWWNC